MSATQAHDPCTTGDLVFKTFLGSFQCVFQCLSYWCQKKACRDRTGTSTRLYTRFAIFEMLFESYLSLRESRMRMLCGRGSDYICGLMCNFQKNICCANCCGKLSKEKALRITVQFHSCMFGCFKWETLNWKMVERNSFFCDAKPCTWHSITGETLHMSHLQFLLWEVGGNQRLSHQRAARLQTSTGSICDHKMTNSNHGNVHTHTRKNREKRSVNPVSSGVDHQEEQNRYQARQADDETQPEWNTWNHQGTNTWNHLKSLERFNHLHLLQLAECHSLKVKDSVIPWSAFRCL